MTWQAEKQKPRASELTGLLGRETEGEGLGGVSRPVATQVTPHVGLRFPGLENNSGNSVEICRAGARRRQQAVNAGGQEAIEGHRANAAQS